MDAVTKARANTNVDAVSAPVAAFRESLFEQFDPVFTACWEKLYFSLTEQRKETVSRSQPSQISATVRYAPDTEFAVAATDETSAAGALMPNEARTIEYLTAHLGEILRHGNGQVWFAMDSLEAFIGHTYDQTIADSYPDKSGPHGIPAFVRPSELVEPHVQRLLSWLTSEVGLSRSAVEQVCVNLGLRW